jgi:hypothetical protein
MKNYFFTGIMVHEKFIVPSSSHLIVCKAQKHAPCVRLLAQHNSFPHSFSPIC